VFEGLWHAAGHETEQGNFFQALIQLAATNLKCFIGNRQAAENLLLSGIARLEMTPKSYMGVDVAGLIEELRQRLSASNLSAPLIGLTVCESTNGVDRTIR
jgi:predicted metal-dependent hydrolase